MDLSHITLQTLATNNGTPLFVYDRQYLADKAQQLMDLRLPYGLTTRYAMKANNNTEIIRLFDKAGLSFDASSGYEVAELLEQGIDPTKISLSSQQPAHNLTEIVAAGVKYVATSLHQLELFIAQAPKDATVGLRVNPDVGAGYNNRNTTSGANSSFGLWKTYVPDALTLAKEAAITINRLHIHIGSGADPKMWGEVMDVCLDIAEQMPDVTSLDIGGGFKVHRFGSEQEANMIEIAEVFSERLQSFAKKTGRKLHLEIEPGTWLVAHASTLLAEVVDIVDTGDQGHTFLRLNTGMNDIIRPTLYGARHAITVLSDNDEKMEYVVVGHNCETSDILTPVQGDSESIEPRLLTKASIGDIVAIHDTGAYCASLSAHGYNSYPSAKQIFV